MNILTVNLLFSTLVFWIALITISALLVNYYSFSRDTSAEFFLRTLLELAGIGWGEVRVVDMPPQDLADLRADVLEGHLSTGAVQLRPW